MNFWQSVLKLLADNPLILLFMVAGIGYPLGRIKFGGVRLGVAFVLFIGLAFGALDQTLIIPEAVYLLGLVFFVYTIGLSSGSVFLESIRKQGLKANALVISGLLAAFGIAAASHYLFNIKASFVAGLFSGATTNTPALAAVIETLKASAVPGFIEQIEAEPVVAYSLTYPFGVLGMIIVIYLFQKIWKIKTADTGEHAELQSKTVRITLSRPITAAELMKKYNWDVIFTRLQRGDLPAVLIQGNSEFQAGDLVSLVAFPEILQEVIPFLGSVEEEHLEFDLSHFDKRRIFLSNISLAGIRLSDLKFSKKFEALVSRIRRGDIEFIPHGNTRLALGDQLRIIAPHNLMADIAKYLGDSYRSVSEVDILSLGLGIAMGLLIGTVPIPLPGGIVIKLGIAGGPLLAALVLGAIKRTGSINWDLPYGANLTIRQIGLVIFLAGIGTRAGYNFWHTLITGEGFKILLVGMLITVSMTALVLIAGYRWLKIPFGFLTGLLAGLQTQPAVLGFANEQFGDETPAIGYATVFPVAMVVKIILAQILLILK
jgi:putative transport protein